MPPSTVPDKHTISQRLSNLSARHSQEALMMTEVTEPNRVFSVEYVILDAAKHRGRLRREERHGQG
jgi:hypothetical protein